MAKGGRPSMGDWAAAVAVVVAVVGGIFYFGKDLGKVESKIEQHEKQIQDFNAKLDTLNAQLEKYEQLPKEMEELRKLVKK